VSSLSRSRSDGEREPARLSRPVVRRVSVRGVNVLILVDIRNAHPTAAERRVAQRVVSSIRFG
jgi:hypothetical protein